MILLITGSRTFCEAIPDKPREQFMAERVALGFALDWIKPDAIIAEGDHGATRWARIWAERRSVDVAAGRADSALRFDGVGSIGGLPVFEVRVK